MNPPPIQPRRTRLALGALALALATVLWLPLVHVFFTRAAADFRAPAGVSPKARALAARHLQLWTEPELRQRELERMRASNAEWDFMGRSFLVWSLANLGLRDPASKPRYLEVMDRILTETLQLEQERGIHFFLMPYSRARPFVVQPEQSLFLDGEIALMLASRRLLEEKPEYCAALADRVERIVARLGPHPLHAAESYPDECWTFDHAVALAATRLADRLDGTDHSALRRDWVRVARDRLLHRETGLLLSSFTLTGTPIDGPEGSTLWMVAHCLQLVDEPFARDQYARARHELGRTLCGFSYAREWPPTWRGPTDIDSGPVIPGLDISAGSSGMAFIGASAFDDDAFLASLAATLDFAAFPSRNEGRLRYCASNQVGDAALLYAAVLGPLWESVQAGSQP
jgi:hypothetical protein